MKYEYKYVNVELTEEQQQMVDLGMVKPGAVDNLVMETINAEAEDGWEPLYPFMFPCIWFRKQVRAKRKTTAKKADSGS